MKKDGTTSLIKSGPSSHSSCRFFPAGFLYAFLLVIVLAGCKRRSAFFHTARQLDFYPSASAAEWLDHRLYIMGDDATHVLVLDSNWQVLDSIRLFPGQQARTPKEQKADIESITVVNVSRQPRLLLMGSGSLSPQRDSAILVDPYNRTVTRFSTAIFLSRIRGTGLPEINLEGAATTQNKLLFANRGHLGFPKNYLVVTEPLFWQQQDTTQIKLIKLGAATSSKTFCGISGLTYAACCDQLIVTVSTEATQNVHEDGTIGKSYLWIVDNISGKLKYAAINPDREIDLEALDPAFKGQKIESVCITGVTKNFLQLALTADNDNGSSKLFNISIRKN